MVGVAPPDDDRIRSRRRLPLWMLGVAAADQTTNSDNVDERVLPQASSHSEGKSVTKGPENGVPLQEKDNSGVNSDFPVKCETKRKRKSSNRDANFDGIITETVSGKKKYNGRRRKVQETAASRRRKAKGSDFGSGEEFEVQPPNDDGVELTMDDLMVIAEEYVKVEKNGERQASNRECGSERQVLMTASSCKDSRCLLDVPNSNQSSPAHELASEETVSIGRRTADPAQDMLDLFLGPLLKKPLMKENKSFVKDIAFAYEIERQSQNNVVGEEIEPLMKKKSSLKDKVAMFLD